MTQKKEFTIFTTILIFVLLSMSSSYTVVRTSDRCTVNIYEDLIDFNNLKHLNLSAINNTVCPIQKPTQVKLLTSTNYQPGDTPYKNKVASKVFNCSMGIMLFASTIMAAVSFPHFALIHIPLFMFSLFKIAKNCRYVTKLTISKQCLKQVGQLRFGIKDAVKEIVRGKNLEAIQTGLYFVDQDMQYVKQHCIADQTIEQIAKQVNKRLAKEDRKQRFKEIEEDKRKDDEKMMPGDPINHTNLDDGFILTLDAEVKELEKTKGKRFFKKIPDFLLNKKRKFTKTVGNIFKSKDKIAQEKLAKENESIETINSSLGTTKNSTGDIKIPEQKEKQSLFGKMKGKIGLGKKKSSSKKKLFEDIYEDNAKDNKPEVSEPTI